ncbi:RNA polymerase sigma factor [Caproiciproducens sp. CPB-2]|uniref:RNA polymerase sigma factor n=1 Tax=Caproiciproducens sp. CPB-2 TaxID=3030017 RepID=UPI0023DC6DF6|nr:RNA polymerase sigma factor [Caproiciproducens sp. CPB-2]MDF1495814.1 RNA polymerase sigma factor [Caproiciproducens sp. CPB-2]
MEKRQIAELVNKAQQGTQNAFTVLYEETHNSIYFLALKMLKNEEDALDVVQDTYISAFNNLAKIENSEFFSTWLHQIATNKCKDYLKKNKPVLFADDEQEEVFVGNIEDKDDDFIPQNSLDKAETRHLIMDIIDNSLSDSQRTAIMLFYYEEMSVSKIAEVLECSEGTVKSRLFSARKLIKIGVDEHEKKGVKLYSAAAIPLLTLLLRGIASETDMSPAASGMVIQNIMQQINPGSIGNTSNGGSDSSASSTKVSSKGATDSNTNAISNNKTNPDAKVSSNSETISEGSTKKISKDHSFENSNKSSISFSNSPTNVTSANISLLSQVSMKIKIIAGILVAILFTGCIAVTILTDRLQSNVNAIADTRTSDSISDIQSDSQIFDDDGDEIIDSVNSSKDEEDTLNLQLLWGSTYASYSGYYFAQTSDAKQKVISAEIINVTINGKAGKFEKLSEENWINLKKDVAEHVMMDQEHDKLISGYIVCYEPKERLEKDLTIVITAKITLSDNSSLTRTYTVPVEKGDAAGGTMCYDHNGNTVLKR